MNTAARLSIGTLLASLLLFHAAIALSNDGSLGSNDWNISYGSGYFGWALSTVGDVNGDGFSDVLVGDFSHNSYEGMVYLFYGSAEGLNDTPDWYYGATVYGEFGVALSPAGDVDGDGYGDFLVGAPRESRGQTAEGVVYLFTGGPGGPSLHSTFEADGEYDHFGAALAWAGDVNGDGYDDFLAGAPEWGDYGSPFYVPEQGAARLYYGGPGGPDQTPDWSRTGGDIGIKYGASLAGLGDINGDGYADFAVGAPGYDPYIGNTDHGTVRVYLGSADGPSGPEWTMDGSQNDSRLGEALAGPGDVSGDGYADLVIGEPGLGIFYVAYGAPGGLEGLTGVFPGGTRAGRTLAPAGDANGDGFADFVVGSESGLVWLFTGKEGGIDLEWTYTGNYAAYYGRFLGGAGDVDGDGLGDFLVGAPLYSNALAYFGARPATLEHLEIGVTYGAGAGDHLGAAVAGAGDLNGDGFDDIAYGAPSPNGATPGEVSVHYGSTNGIGGMPDWTVTGGAGTSFGAAVARAGDVNGDGWDDLVIGEPGANSVQVHHGSASGPSPTPDWVHQFSGDPLARFGDAVDGAGDVDGDGFADIVVGAPGFDGALIDQGLVRVFYGSATGLRSEGFTELVGDQAGAHFGAAVTGAGDGDRDGFDEVAVGSPDFEVNGIPWAGFVHVFAGGESGLGDVVWTVAGDEWADRCGVSIDGGADVNGDGYADLIIGEPGDSNGEGRVLVRLGGPTPYVGGSWHTGESAFGSSVSAAGDTDGDGLGDFLALWNNGVDTGVSIIRLPASGGTRKEDVTYAYDWFGAVVASAGDANGDGTPDVVVGLPHATNIDRGYVELRAIGKNWDTQGEIGPRPRLANAAGDPVALGGRLADQSDLRFTALALTPAGRTRTRVEWQVAYVNQAFGDPELGDWSAGVPVGNPPPEIFAELGGGLTEDARYRWRLRVAAANPYLPHGRWLTDAPGLETLHGFTVGNPWTSVGEPDPGDFAATGSRFESLGPNPFRQSTEARFALPAAGSLRARVFDVNGRVVATLAEGWREAGRHAIRWDGNTDSGRRAAAGVYFVRANAAGRTVSGKVILLR